MQLPPERMDGRRNQTVGEAAWCDDGAGYRKGTRTNGWECLWADRKDAEGRHVREEEAGTGVLVE